MRSMGIFRKDGAKTKEFLFLSGDSLVSASQFSHNVMQAMLRANGCEYIHAISITSEKLFDKLNKMFSASRHIDIIIACIAERQNVC